MVRICNAGDQLPFKRVSLLLGRLFGARTLENIQTDTTKFIYVRMIDFCEESDLWGSHWIVVWKKEL